MIKFIETYTMDLAPSAASNLSNSRTNQSSEVDLGWQFGEHANITGSRKHHK